MKINGGRHFCKWHCDIWQNLIPRKIIGLGKQEIYHDEKQHFTFQSEISVFDHAGFFIDFTESETQENTFLFVYFLRKIVFIYIIFLFVCKLFEKFSLFFCLIFFSSCFCVYLWFFCVCKWFEKFVVKGDFVLFYC